MTTPRRSKNRASVSRTLHQGQALALAPVQAQAPALAPAQDQLQASLADRLVLQEAQLHQVVLRATALETADLLLPVKEALNLQAEPPETVALPAMEARPTMVAHQAVEAPAMEAPAMVAPATVALHRLLEAQIRVDKVDNHQSKVLSPPQASSQPNGKSFLPVSVHC